MTDGVQSALLSGSAIGLIFVGAMAWFDAYFDRPSIPLMPNEETLPTADEYERGLCELDSPSNTEREPNHQS
jgi:hypothetical protein